MSQAFSAAVPVRVWKVGGSLLTLPDLDRRLERAMRAVEPARPLIVVGGGEAADLVRRWDRLHRLGQEQAHWLALEALGLNERLLLELLDEAGRVSTRPEAERAWADGRLPVLHAVAFVAAEEGTAPVCLPHCWDVTSDSVAAWVAAVWPATELVLLKSTELPPGLSHAGAAERKLVDPWFPQAASHVAAIRWINLRADPTHVATLSASS
ncbi:MAG TPA: uridylate kinase [Planctomycetaceae bacterium]|nr:uridylate kinase [Planctomycetaceae bacterium]